MTVESPPLLSSLATGAAGGGDAAAGRVSGTAMTVASTPHLASPATSAAGLRFLLAPRSPQGLPMASRPAQTQDARAAAGSAGAGDEDAGAFAPNRVAAFAADVAGRSGGGGPIVIVLRPRTARAALERSLRSTHKERRAEARMCGVSRPSWSVARARYRCIAIWLAVDICIVLLFPSRPTAMIVREVSIPLRP